MFLLVALVFVTPDQVGGATSCVYNPIRSGNAAQLNRRVPERFVTAPENHRTIQFVSLEGSKWCHFQRSFGSSGKRQMSLLAVPGQVLLATNFMDVPLLYFSLVFAPAVTVKLGSQSSDCQTICQDVSIH